MLTDRAAGLLLTVVTCKFAKKKKNNRRKDILVVTIFPKMEPSGAEKPLFPRSPGVTNACHTVGRKYFANGRKNELGRKLLYFKEHVNIPFV